MGKLGAVEHKVWLVVPGPSTLEPLVAAAVVGGTGQSCRYVVRDWDTQGLRRMRDCRTVHTVAAVVEEYTHK